MLSLLRADFFVLSSGNQTMVSMVALRLFKYPPTGQRRLAPLFFLHGIVTLSLCKNVLSSIRHVVLHHLSYHSSLALCLLYHVLPSPL